MTPSGCDHRSVTRRTAWAILLAAFAALSGLVRAGDGGGDPYVHVLSDDTVRLEPEALANLSLCAATREAFPDVLTVMGTIVPVETRVTSVPARTAGRIDSLLKVTGQTVRVGDALALEYSPDFVEARQEYLEALKRSKRGAPGSPSDPDFRDLVAITREKLRNMGLTDADIAGLPTNPGRDLVIRATHPGAITAVDTAVGDMQNQGDTLMVVTDLGRVWFDGDVYSEDLPKVRVDQGVDVHTGGPNGTLKGRISFISPVLDPGAHTIKVRALVDNPGRELRAGMVVEGDITLSRREALVVPLGAVLNLHGGWWCYKRTGPGRFTRVAVVEGGEARGLAVITRGLAPGDVVVCGGGLVLNSVFSVE